MAVDPDDYRTLDLFGRATEAPPASPAHAVTDLPTGGDSSALRILDLAGVVVRALDEWEALFAALHPDDVPRLRADVVRIVGGGRD